MRLLALHNQVLQQAVTTHQRTVIKTVGDAFLVDFPSVVNAVQCAQQVQAHFRTHNAEKESAEQIHVRIGIHLGDIIQQDGDVFGDGVNIASRLQTLAEPDTICISQKVYEEVEKKLSLGAVLSLGRPKLKNIAQRFGVYLLLPEQPRDYARLSKSNGSSSIVGCGLYTGWVWPGCYSSRCPRHCPLFPFFIISHSPLSRPSRAGPFPCPTNPPLLSCPSPT